MNKEIDFEAAIKELKLGRIIESKESNYKYKLVSAGKNKKMKFYNPVIDSWAISSFISTEEMLSKWIVVV